MNIFENTDTNTHKTYVVFEVKITPGSSRNKVLGTHHNALKIAIQAPPEKDKANQMLIDFLSQQCNISKKQITILKGKTQAVKKIRISEFSSEKLKEYLIHE